MPDGLDKCGLITDKGMQYLWNRTGCSTSWAELLKLDGGNGLRTYWSQQIDGGASDMMAYCNATLHKRATPQQLQCDHATGGDERERPPEARAEAKAEAAQEQDLDQCES